MLPRMKPKPKMPELVVFLIKWTAIGVAAGLGVLAVVLALDLGGLAAMTFHSPSRWVVLYILANSFGVSGATLTVGIAIWVRHDFGGDGVPHNPRLARWKAGESAVIRPDEQDRPLP